MKKLMYIFLLGTALLTTSCNNWLDVLPTDEQVTENYWTSKEDVQAVLASGYYYMRTTTPQLIDWGELRGFSIQSYLDLTKTKLQNFQMTAESSLCKWEQFYNVLNMANSVIKYAPQVADIDGTYSEGAMRSHQAEAYFMRAWAYFVLVRNFKEVPLVLEPYVDDSAPFGIAKSSEEEIIAQIKKDILTALNSDAAKEYFDDDKWDGATKGRVTKWALYALMSDVCLWSGDYDGCITYADYLINATASHRPAFMSVPEQWFSIFNPGNSNESIFELNWDYTSGQTAYSPSNYFTLTTNSSYRYSSSMMERMMDENAEVVKRLKEPVRTEYGAYINLGDATTPIGVIWKYKGTELPDATAIRTNNDANYIIYRMADVMLMEAEALIWKGSDGWQKAVDIINTIRKRSNLSNLDVNISEMSELSMLQLVLYERDIEFAGEGKRWYDLLRFGKSKDYKYKENFINEIVANNTSANASWLRSVLNNVNAWYLPIYYEEIEDNKALVQNPYYSATSK